MNKKLEKKIKELTEISEKLEDIPQINHQMKKDLKKVIEENKKLIKNTPKEVLEKIDKKYTF